MIEAKLGVVVRGLLPLTAACAPMIRTALNNRRCLHLRPGLGKMLSVYADRFPH